MTETLEVILKIHIFKLETLLYSINIISNYTRDLDKLGDCKLTVEILNVVLITHYDILTIIKPIQMLNMMV